MMLRYIAGPVIGSVIGYFTNYIAVKMLFYPRNEIRLFGHRLPLTPGAIPKGKSRLAKAIGTAVGEQLLTGMDVKEKLMDPVFTDQMAERILVQSEQSLHVLGSQLTDDADAAGQLQEKIVNLLTDEIFDSVKKLPLADLIVEKGADAIKARTAGTMLQMFLTDEMIESIAGPAGLEIEAYINQNGRDYIAQEVQGKCAALAQAPASELLARVQPERDRQKEMIISIYRHLADRGITGLMKEINIAGMVEDKINAMDIDTLETLVMTVMKKELNTIVNLGALIGFVLGLINLFF